MRVFVKVLDGPLAGGVIAVDEGVPVTIGRSQDAGVVTIPDQALSRVHFVVERSGRSCRVRDLGSSNGTFLNAASVTEAWLQAGDRIAAGETSFEIMVEADSAPAAGPPRAPVASQETRYAPAAVATRPGPAYAGALKDDDEAVQREALWAAAWAREPWLPGYLRALLAKPEPAHGDAMLLLAILGEAADIDLLMAAARVLDPGPERFRVLTAFGHPGVVEELLNGLDDEDPAIAADAGWAFERLTGCELARSPADPEDASDDAPERPDPAAARLYWRDAHERFFRSARWRRGLDLSGEPDDATIQRLDLQGRFETCLRGRFHGWWQGTLADLERLGEARP